MDLLRETAPPRIIKTHLSPHFFEKQRAEKKFKIIVVQRNIKDVLVSFYHFYRTVNVYGPYKGSWCEFFEIFKAKRLVYGDWFEINLAWWALKDDPNVLILIKVRRYEK